MLFQLNTKPQTIYPTFDTCSEAVSHAMTQLPITDCNVMFSVLMAYHNSLLKELSNEQKETVQ